MIHFNGPTTIHTAIDGDAGEVRVTVTPDAATVAQLQARVAELEARAAELAAYCRRGGGDWYASSPAYDDGLHAAYNDVVRWLTSRGLVPEAPNG